MKTATRDIVSLPNHREEWTLEELQDEADALRQRINRFRTSLGRYFVAKQDLIDLMVLAAVAQAPLLLVGPPGPAKSDLVLQSKHAVASHDPASFDHLPPP